MSDRTQPLVKPLEFALNGYGYVAKSIVGEYEVFPAVSGGHWFWRHESDSELDQVPPGNKQPDLDAAKAEAQADYERRILSALVCNGENDDE